MENESKSFSDRCVEAQYGKLVEAVKKQWLEECRAKRTALFDKQLELLAEKAAQTNEVSNLTSLTHSMCEIANTLANDNYYYFG